MKKNNLILSALSLLALVACNGNNTSNNSNSINSIVGTTSSSSVPGVVYGDETDLIISEYVEGTGMDKAIEVCNISNKEIDLSEYAINQYRNDYVPTVTIQLEGKLAAGDVYVVAYEGSSEEVLSKADLTHPGLYFSGKNAISVTRKGKVVDLVGFIGYSLEYAKDMTLVRKVDQMYGRNQYDEYDWIRYAPDNFKYLGNAENSVTPEELLAGPVLEDRYLDYQQYSFVMEGTNSIGGGLAVEASIKSNIDGDTTNLIIEDEHVDPSKFMTSRNYYGLQGGKYWVRVRYQSVDTPESYSGNIQPFGKMAAAYTAYLQNKADKIYLQSVHDSSLLCNYGRLMGYVWADRDTLVNFETIKHGYSDVAFSFNYGLTSRDVPYETYMYNARIYAQRNKLGLFGEQDPYWDYENNVSYCEDKTCGNYFENGGSIY